VFVQKQRIVDRGVITRLLADPARDTKDLQYYLQKQTYENLAGKNRKEIGEWFERVGGYLHRGPDGNLTVDTEAEAFGTSPARLEFFDKAIAALSDPDHNASARKLLNRYVPEGAGKDASVEMWRVWLKENQPYLFFSDTGGYRWYIDPLEKKRGMPTTQLRGPARATKSAVVNGRGRRD